MKDRASTSIRERFGIDQQNIASAWRLIKEAVGAAAIVPFDAGTAPKMMKRPWWAQLREDLRGT